MINSNHVTKSLKLFVYFISIFILFLVPSRVDAAKDSEKPYFTCTYKLNGKDANGIKTVPYINGKTLTISLALDKKTIIKNIPEEGNWNFFDDFDNKFRSEAKKNTCPSIGIKGLIDAYSVEVYPGSAENRCPEGQAALCETFKGTGKLTGEKSDDEARPFLTCKYTITKGNLVGLKNIRGKDIEPVIISLSMDKTTVVKSIDEHINVDFFDSFDDTFRKTALTGSCPTLGVVYVVNSDFFNLYPHSLGQIANTQKNLGNLTVDVNAENDGSLSQEAQETTQKVTYNSCMLDIPFWEFQDSSKEYRVSFRIASNGIKQWSMTEKGVADSTVWVDLKNGSESDLFAAVIQLSDGSGHVRIAKDLFDYVFADSSKPQCKVTQDVIRNVDHSIENSTGSTNYILSFEKIDMYRSWTENDANLSYLAQRRLRKNSANLDGLNQTVSCSQLFSTQDEGSVFWLLQKLLTYIKILGPILVIILSAVDFIKAIAASDEDSIKKAQSKLTIRLIAVVALFLIPTFVELALQIISGASDPTCILK